MVVLGLDTCLDACSAAVVEGGRTLARAAEPMSRGHQERLAPLAEMVVAQAGLAFNRIARVGVTVGPGSFTGLRVGLAFARSMALALDIPCAGIGVLEALATGREGLVLAIIDARRDQAYWQAFENGSAVCPPAASKVADVVDFFSGRGREIIAVGPGAAMVEGCLPNARIAPVEAPAPEALLALAARRDPGTPLYLRTPDAKLPGGKVLGE